MTTGNNAVTVADDGAGVADPALLLAFGDSGWDPAVARAEDAAGWGLAAAARRGCTVRWRCPGDAPGYRVILDPGHFLGRKAAPVEPDGSAPHGTAVTFPASESEDIINRSLADAARHYPLPVTLDGKALGRRAFLDGAVHAEKWRGIAFGVFRGRHTGFREPDLNFHGLTLHTALPEVKPVRGKTWTVLADVESCPQLELVLPARREPVATPFLAEMREAARLAAYRAMAEAAPCLAYEDWKRAADAGIDLPEPKPALRPWRPATADVDRWVDAPNPVSLGGITGQLPFLVTADLEHAEQQTLYRAACRAGISHRLFDAERGFEGYPWYDRLVRLDGIAIRATVGGVPHPAGTFRAPGACPDAVRPESISIELRLVPPGGAPDSTVSIPADVAFAGEDGSWVEDADPLVTKDSDLTPGALATLIVDSYFCPLDEAEADSYDTQRREAEARALHAATRLLVSDDEARRRSIANAVWRELLWLMPEDRDVDIKVRGGRVDVTLGASPAGT